MCLNCSLGALVRGHRWEGHEHAVRAPKPRACADPARDMKPGVPVAGLLMVCCGRGTAALAAPRVAETDTPSPRRYYICIALKAEAGL